MKSWVHGQVDLLFLCLFLVLFSFCYFALSKFNVIVFYLISFYFDIFCCFISEDCSFLVRDIKGVDLYRRKTGKELGGIKEGKTNQHICMRKFLLLKTGEMEKQKTSNKISKKLLYSKGQIGILQNWKWFLPATNSIQGYYTKYIKNSKTKYKDKT